MAHYLDTSSLVKLVVTEAETPALRRWFRGADRHPVSCDLVPTELMRSVRRRAPGRLLAARALLDRVTLLEVTPEVFEEAGRLDPASRGGLDTVHLAAALTLGEDLDGLVTYDERLAEAARANGVPVMAPA